MVWENCNKASVGELLNETNHCDHYGIHRDGAEIARILANKRFYERLPAVIGSRGPMEDGLRMVNSDLKLNIIAERAGLNTGPSIVDLTMWTWISCLACKVAAMGGKAAFEYRQGHRPGHGRDR